MHYPLIDPIIVELGPFAVRWYGLAYLAAFFVAWWLGTRRAEAAGWSRQEVADIVFYGAVGAVLGGRIGYALFYGRAMLAEDPTWLLRVWEGGMSFHGGLIGVLVAMAWFGRRTRRPFFAVADFVAPIVPVGLGFGRLGNFVNMELPGRESHGPVGLVYPCDAVRQLDPLCTGVWESFARHPSPLYQAVAEGVVLFVIVWWFSSRPRPLAAVSGVFLLGYGGLRIFTEFFREPDVHIGFVALDWLTMGQLLSLPMVIFGVALIVLAQRKAA
jgi:phosphatidylglycerol:prolipoprotein diacylglycerol transferase